MTKEVIVDNSLLTDVRKLIDLIMGGADKSDIDSLAHWIGHTSYILNPDEAQSKEAYALACLQKASVNATARQVEDYDEILACVIGTRTLVDKDSIYTEANLI